MMITVIITLSDAQPSEIGCPEISRRKLLKLQKQNNK